MLATDPQTGETEPERVTATITGQGEKQLVEVTVDVDGDRGSATDSVTATGEHPFWVPNRDEWVDAADLQAGDRVRTAEGEQRLVTGIRTWTALQRVHNLTINNTHTYYVDLNGHDETLVHNSDCDWPPYGQNSADEHYDKHVLGMDDDGNFTRTPDMPEYDTEDGFDRYVADSQALMCPDACPSGVREGKRDRDNTWIRYEMSTGKIGMKRDGQIVSYFRPDAEMEYFSEEVDW
ncbi:hypothetical protein J2S53_002044 [Actinopolyspora lacussalsi]|nr:hypothetical protein [Actinopolyspora lacussalsi]